jgi:hypothetical protein
VIKEIQEILALKEKKEMPLLMKILLQNNLQP